MSNKIIIAPYAKAMRNGKPHPKNYPWWPELLKLMGANTLTGPHVIQIGVEGEQQLTPDFRKNLKLHELSKLVVECRTWISVDSFFQHFCWDLGKPGIALFGPSDPQIFGHHENTNLFASHKHFREKQFWLWEQAEFNPEAFVKPEVVVEALKAFP